MLTVSAQENWLHAEHARLSEPRSREFVTDFGAVHTGVAGNVSGFLMITKVLMRDVFLAKIVQPQPTDLIEPAFSSVYQSSRSIARDSAL